jgi:hypothetical protein
VSRGALLAAALALSLSAGAGATSAPGAKAYRARVSTVCLTYARRLERIAAPSDPAAYGNVIASLRRVVPLLEAQERAMRAVPPPAALEPEADRLFALDRRSIAPLTAALGAAHRHDAAGVARGLVRFASLRDRVHAAALALGIRCEPN